MIVFNPITGGGGGGFSMQKINTPLPFEHTASSFATTQLPFPEILPTDMGSNFELVDIDQDGETFSYNEPQYKVLQAILTTIGKAMPTLIRIVQNDNTALRFSPLPDQHTFEITANLLVCSISNNGHHTALGTPTSARQAKAWLLHLLHHRTKAEKAKILDAYETFAPYDAELVEGFAQPANIGALGDCRPVIQRIGDPHIHPSSPSARSLCACFDTTTHLLYLDGAEFRYRSTNPVQHDWVALCKAYWTVDAVQNKVGCKFIDGHAPVFIEVTKAPGAFPFETRISSFNIEDFAVHDYDNKGWRGFLNKISFPQINQVVGELTPKLQELGYTLSFDSGELKIATQNTTYTLNDNNALKTQAAGNAQSELFISTIRDFRTWLSNQFPQLQDISTTVHRIAGSELRYFAARILDL